MVIRIQPDEGIELQFNMKKLDDGIRPLSMEYIRASGAEVNTSQAYERLLSDIMRGDQTLFTRWDELEQAWKITDSLRKMKTTLHLYKAGSHGPRAALDLITKDGRDWFGDRPLERLVKVVEKR